MYGRKLGLPFLDDMTQNGGIPALQALSADVVVVSDYGFIFADVRERAVKKLREMYPGCEIEWRAFTNEPEQCWRNVQHRNDGRVFTEVGIRRAAEAYTLPETETVTIVPVYRGHSGSSTV